MELVRGNLKSIVFERIFAEIKIEECRAIKFKHFRNTR